MFFWVYFLLVVTSLVRNSSTTECLERLFYTGFPRFRESPGIPGSGESWKNEFGPGKTRKLKFRVLESHWINLCFKLADMRFMYRTACVNKCIRYSSKLLTEQFLHNLWWTFRDCILHSVTLYASNCCLSVYLNTAVLWRSPGKTVCRLRGNIIRTAPCWVVWHNVHSQQHTHVSSSYRSSRLGLSHWDPYTMLRGDCLELYYCNMVEWSWWDSGLIWKTNWFPSVLWHCWFGHMTCKSCPRYDL